MNLVLINNVVCGWEEDHLLAQPFPQKVHAPSFGSDMIFIIYITVVDCFETLLNTVYLMKLLLSITSATYTTHA